MSDLMNSFRRLESALDNNNYLLTEAIQDSMKELEIVVNTVNKLLTVEVKTELRVYVINLRLPVYIDVFSPSLTDEQFMTVSEEQGSVYTLQGFTDAYNKDIKLSMIYELIRFIKRTSLFIISKDKIKYLKLVVK
jgi:hypothetical protein